MTMITIWETMLTEPRWIAIIGLVLDAIGAVLVAITAWLRISGVAVLGNGGPNVHEEHSGLAKRRWLVVVGALLLVVGFIMQAVAAWMQMGHKPPGQWTI